MKKIISKILIIFIIMIMLFEFTFSTNVSYAALDITDEFLNSLTSLMGGIVAYGIWMDRLILLGLSTVFNGFMSTTFAASCGVNEGWAVGIATPYSIFFNKYKLFDVNFFDFDKTTSNGPVLAIRQEVAEWFYIIRNISSAVLLCILIYVGIRMALSTVAEEKAKFKKMFFDWACSLALIYVLQYIMIFTVYSNNAIVNALKAVYEQNIATAGSGVVDMDTAILQMATQAVMPVGLGSIVATFVYAMVILQTIAFMISYTQRMLKTGFLILISPLISITYSIDKMGDGKAQALNAWLKEFVYTILIQPFHCLIYMTFVTSAIALLSKSTILGSLKSIFTGDFNQLTNGVVVILCLKFVNDGEKAIRKIFNFQDDDSLTSMAAGAMVGVAAVKKAASIAGTVSGSPNAAKNMMKDMKGNLKKFQNDFKNSDIGKRAAKGMGNAKQSLSNVAAKNPKLAAAAKGVSKAASKTTSKLKKGGKWVGSKTSSAKSKYKAWSDRKHAQWANDANDTSQNKHIRGAKSWLRKQIPTAHNLKNAMPRALGMMAAAMTFAAGDNGVMEAIGVGSAVQESSEKLFSNTLGTMSDQNKDAVGKAESAQLDLEKDKRDNDVMDAANNNPKLKNRFNSQEKLQRELSSFMKDQAILAEYKDGSKHKRTSRKHWEQARERMKQRKKDGIYKALASRAELEGEGGEKYKEDLRKKRIERNSSELPAGSFSYGVEEIEKKAQQILELLDQYNQLLQADSGGDRSFDALNHLSLDNDAKKSRMMSMLKNSVDRSLMFGTDGKFDAGSLLENEIGLKNNGSSQFRELVSQVLEYREMVANDKIEDIYSNCEKLNIRRASLDEASFGK